MKSMSLEKQETDHDFAISVRPVARIFSGLVAIYYIIITINHLFSEAGETLWKLISLSLISSFVAGAACLFTRQTVSIRTLEISGIITNFLLIINTVYFYSLHYDRMRLI